MSELGWRESIEQAFDSCDNEHDGVASQSKTDNMRAARLGATPLGRAARQSGVDE